jgi:transcription elongation factor GreB
VSKAFVRESDSPEAEDVPRRQAALPPGSTNYMTPAGAERLREEFRHLRETERPALAAQLSPHNPEGKRRLQVVDRRLQELEASLRVMEVVVPASGPQDTVRFGTAVTVRDRAGDETTFRIVGVEEAQPARNWISWVSPAARALINGRVGQKVTVRRPGGHLEWEIRRIAAAGTPE